MRCRTAAIFVAVPEPADDTLFVRRGLRFEVILADRVVQLVERWRGSVGAPIPGFSVNRRMSCAIVVDDFAEHVCQV